MNRRQLADARARAEAIVRVTKQLLDADLRAELEDNESRASYDFGWGKLTAAQEQDSLEVVHDQDFFEWVRERYPHQVEVVLRVPNTEWLTKLRAQIHAELVDPDNPRTECPPGTKLHSGGAFKYASLSVGAAEKARLDAAYLAALQRGENPVVSIPFQVEE